ncbi:MAG: diguanylate cyclase [Candidatus Sericytochromatia bacterium]
MRYCREFIRNKIEDMEIQVPIGDNLKMTVSIGVAIFPDNGETLEEFFREVEESLYKAKREGKNRVISNVI